MLKGKFVGSYKKIREELQTEEKTSDIIKLTVLEAQKVKNTLLKPSNKKQSTSDHQRRQHRKGLLVQTGKIH